MSLQVEKLEKNMAKLTIEVPAEELEKRLTMLTGKTGKKSVFPVSGKGKFRVR